MCIQMFSNSDWCGTSSKLTFLKGSLTTLFLAGTGFPVYSSTKVKKNLKEELRKLSLKREKLLKEEERQKKIKVK